nr:immunoglobulin light chain junction region [Macaca mulatta]
CLQYSISPFIF